MNFMTTYQIPRLFDINECSIYAQGYHAIPIRFILPINFVSSRFKTDSVFTNITA